MNGNNALRSAAPAEGSPLLLLLDEKFYTASLGIFRLVDLQQPLDSDMPHARKILWHALSILAELVAIFYEINEKIESAACVTQQLNSLEIPNADEDIAVWSLTLDILRRYKQVTQSLFAVGETHLEHISVKLKGHRDETIPNESGALAEKIKRCEKLLPTEKHLSLFISLAHKLSIKRKDSNELADIQRQVTGYRKEMDLIDGFTKRSQESVNCAYDSKRWWVSLQRQICDTHTMFLNDNLPTKIMTPHLKANILKIFRDQLKDLNMISEKMQAILTRISKDFGPTACINAKISVFRLHVNDISGRFRPLFAIQNIQKDRQETIANQTRVLVRCTQKHLSRIQSVLSQWAPFTGIDSAAPSQFTKDICDLGMENLPFQSTYKDKCHEIRSLLEKNMNNGRKAKVPGDGTARRMKVGGSVTTVTQAFEILDGLEEILYEIAHFSTAFMIDLLLYARLNGSDGTNEVHSGRQGHTFVVDDTHARDTFRVLNNEIAGLIILLQKSDL